MVHRILTHHLPLYFLAVEDQPLPAQQNVQASVAEATPFRGKLADSAAQHRIIRSPAAIPDHASVHTRKGTRPPLAQLVASAQMFRQAMLALELRGCGQGVPRDKAGT